MDSKNKIILAIFSIFFLIQGTVFAQFSDINNAEDLAIANVRDANRNNVVKLENEYKANMKIMIAQGKSIDALLQEYYKKQAEEEANYQQAVRDAHRKAEKQREDIRDEDAQKKKEEDARKQAQDEDVARGSLAPEWILLQMNLKNIEKAWNDLVKELTDSSEKNQKDKKKLEETITADVGECKLSEVNIAHSDAGIIESVFETEAPKCQARYRFFIGGTSHKSAYETKNRANDPVGYDFLAKFSDYRVGMIGIEGALLNFAANFPETDTKIFSNLNRNNFFDSVKSLGSVECGCENGYRDYFNYFILSDALPKEIRKYTISTSLFGGSTINETVSLPQMIAGPGRETQTNERKINNRVNLSYPYNYPRPNSWVYNIEEFPDKAADSLSGQISDFANHFPGCEQTISFIGRGTDELVNNDQGALNDKVYSVNFPNDSNIIESMPRFARLFISRIRRDVARIKWNEDVFGKFEALDVVAALNYVATFF